jgi:hypothetical protein
MVAASALGRSAYGATSETAVNSTGFSKTRILRIYLGGRSGWPALHVDPDVEMKRLQGEIDKVPGLDDVEFVGNIRVTNPSQLTRILEQNKVDGVLAVQVGMGTSFLIAVLANMGIPTVMLAIPYSGHEWCIVPDIQQMGKKIDTIPTSDFKDVTKAIRPFRAIHRLKETKILYLAGGRTPVDKFIAEVKKRFGTEIKDFDHKILVDAYEKIDPKAADPETERWIKGAEKVKEPSREEIAKSARLYLAMRQVIADEKAQAITINCLGLFGRKELPAYPCLGYCRMNNMGLVGVCEADLTSALTQVIYQHMEGVPGFVTDPVFDTSNNTVIHAHCVSATKMDGPNGPAAPYVIRSHHEDNKGASLQVKMRVGQEITMAKIAAALPAAKEMPRLAATPISSLGTDTMLISTGTIVDVPDVDRGCRTKITTKVRDARKMLEGWRHGLHRVIFYGNHMEDTRRLGILAGFNVVEEG